MEREQHSKKVNFTEIQNKESEYRDRGGASEAAISCSSRPGSPARGLARNPPSSPPPPPSPPPLPPQPPPPPMQPLASLTERSAFESALGGVYEKSAWVASRTFDKGPFSSLSALATAMRETVDSATEVSKPGGVKFDLT
eukprot:5757817-Pleurochrysis_carterae.AAC.3